MPILSSTELVFLFVKVLINNYKLMKIETLEQFHREGGKASAKKRLAGLSKEEISEYMRAVRSKQTPQQGKERKLTGLGDDGRKFVDEKRYPVGIE